MTRVDDDNRFKRKWWVNPMDPEHMAELSDSDRRNARRFNQWLFVWGLMFFGVALGMEPLPGGLEATPAWRLLLAVAPLVPGIFLVRAFIRLFSEIKDAFIKGIYREALAVGFLFAFVLGMCFELSVAVIGESAKAGPVMFGGLIMGYYLSLILSNRKYNA